MTGRRMTGEREWQEAGVLGPAGLIHSGSARLSPLERRATRMEPAARRDAGGVGDLAGEDGLLHALDLRDHGEQCARVGVLWALEDLLGAPTNARTKSPR